MKNIGLAVIVFLLSNYILIAQTNVAWKFETNGRVYSSPAIKGDMIYFGSGDNTFYALNKTTGEKAWTFTTEGAIHSSPYVTNTHVYFGSADGNLYALNRSSGELIWKFTSKGEKMYDLWDYYLSSPIVDSGTVFWGCGDGNVYALDGNDGKIKWKFEVGDIVHATPAVYNNHVYIGGFDGYFYSIDKTTGELSWKFKTVGATYFPKGEIQRAALVKDDVVYFGSRDYNIYALNAKTGRGSWNLKQERGWIIAKPIEYKDNIYFGTSDAHIFYSMDKVKGTINWTIPVSMRVYGTAVAHDDLIFFGTFDGKVLGIDHETGETKWQFQTESSKLNYHTMYNDKGEFKEGFELYGKGYEESERMIHALGSILSSPVIDNQIIYFGSSDGNMYAVRID